MAQVSYPGVYIEEFAPAPPIQPAATSVAAFVGFADPMAEDPARIGEPLRITSFSQFQRRFGKRPVSGFYLWYAVRGFFENGGTDCFVVRASNGQLAKWTVKNASGAELYRIATKVPMPGDDITINVEDPRRLTFPLGVFEKTFTVTAGNALIEQLRASKTLIVEDGHLLRPGDRIQAKQSLAVVQRITVGESDTLVYLDKPLTDLERDVNNKITFSLTPLLKGDVELRIEYPAIANDDIKTTAVGVSNTTRDTLNTIAQTLTKREGGLKPVTLPADEDNLADWKTAASDLEKVAAAADDQADGVHKAKEACTTEAGKVRTTLIDKHARTKAVETHATDSKSHLDNARDRKKEVENKLNKMKILPDPPDPGELKQAVSDVKLALVASNEQIESILKAIASAQACADATASLAISSPSTTSDEPLPPDSLVAGAIMSIGAHHYTVDRVIVENCNAPSKKKEGESPTRVTYRVLLRSPLQEDIPRATRNDTQDATIVTLHESQLTVTRNNLPKPFRIAIDPVHPDYATDVVKRMASFLTLEVASSSIEAKDLIPVAEKLSITNGKDENATNFRVEGWSLLPAALDTLRRVPEVNIVAIPDACGLDTVDNKNVVMQAIIAHCENMGERFGVLDAHAPDQQMFEKKADQQTIEEQLGASVSTRGYAALYYPWIKTRPAGSGRVLATVPPSGHVCGLLARVDKARGVHKAPANETLNDAVAITQDMSDQEQGVLNLQGINVIRTFTSGGRPIVFGARTTASNKSWQYVNVRRLFLFLEESIATSLRSSLFEPNNTELWGRLKRVITAFLTEQWQAGALFGRKAEEAFYVKIDDELNPFNERALGKLNMEIGVCPTFPAEFIVVRIGIWDGGKAVSES